MTVPRSAVAGVAILALSVSTGISAATGAQPGSYPQRFCRSVNVHHEHFGVEGSDALTCRFMRTWSVRFLRDARAPRHWRCVDVGETGGCHRPYRHRLQFDWYIID